MASAIPIDHGIAGEQRVRSGDFFTFTAMGAALKGAEPASDGSRERSLSRERYHRRSAGGDGRPR